MPVSALNQNTMYTLSAGLGDDTSHGNCTLRPSTASMDTMGAANVNAGISFRKQRQVTK